MEHTNKKLDMFEVRNEDRCNICFENRIDCVLLECGHAVVQSN